jgi:hypothetical protein
MFSHAEGEETANGQSQNGRKHLMFSQGIGGNSSRNYYFQ